MIQIVIISAIRLYRDGLAHLIGGDGRLQVVGAFATIDRALDDLITSAAQPDVVLLDTTEPSALRGMRRLSVGLPGAKVVALGVAQNDDVIACAEAGVAGYVFRDASIEELCATLQSSARGELRCSPELAGALMRRIANLARDVAPGDGGNFTRREQEIVDLVERGLSNKEIASLLFIEVATVKNHIHNILAKLEVRTRGEAAAKLRRRRGGGRNSGPTAAVDLRR